MGMSIQLEFLDWMRMRMRLGKIIFMDITHLFIRLRYNLN